MNYKKNISTYVKYLRAYVKREGIDRLIGWLGTTDVTIAPASANYHLNCEGGLVQHSLNVFNRLIKLIQIEYGSIENSPYTKETIAIVSLLHDLSKVNFYEKYTKNVKNNETGLWDSVLCYKVRDDENKFNYSGHEENSIYMIQNFIKLTYDECLAIRWHSGCFGLNNTADVNRCMYSYKTSKLALLLHTADMMATCIDDVECVSERVDVRQSTEADNGSERNNTNTEHTEEHTDEAINDNTNSVESNVSESVTNNSDERYNELLKKLNAVGNSDERDTDEPTSDSTERLPF